MLLFCLDCAAPEDEEEEEDGTGCWFDATPLVKTDAYEAAPLLLLFCLDCAGPEDEEEEEDGTGCWFDATPLAKTDAYDFVCSCLRVFITLGSNVLNNSLARSG